MESLNEKIKRIRTDKNIKQIVVAEASGLSRGAYIMIENGKTQTISIESGKGISQALGIPFTELFEIENSGSESGLLKARIDDLEGKLDILNTQSKNNQLLIEMLNKEKSRHKRDVLGFLEELQDSQTDNMDQIQSTSGMNSLLRKDIQNSVINIINTFAKSSFCNSDLISESEIDEITTKYIRIVKPGDQEQK